MKELQTVAKRNQHTSIVEAVETSDRDSIAAIASEKKKAIGDERRYRTEIHSRFSMAASCFFFTRGYLEAVLELGLLGLTVLEVQLFAQLLLPLDDVHRSLNVIRVVDLN